MKDRPCLFGLQVILGDSQSKNSLDLSKLSVIFYHQNLGLLVEIFVDLDLIIHPSHVIESSVLHLKSNLTFKI